MKKIGREIKEIEKIAYNGFEALRGLPIYNTSVGSLQYSPCTHRGEVASLSGIWLNMSRMFYCGPLTYIPGMHSAILQKSPQSHTSRVRAWAALQTSTNIFYDGGTHSPLRLMLVLTLFPFSQKAKKFQKGARDVAEQLIKRMAAKDTESTTEAHLNRINRALDLIDQALDEGRYEGSTDSEPHVYSDFLSK